MTSHKTAPLLATTMRTRARYRDFFVDNQPGRIHLIFEMILADWLCAMGVRIPFSRYSIIYHPRGAAHTLPSLASVN